MTTQQIQCIITLAEEGSFSKAAKKLFVTQPSISQLIKNMEMQLGAPLFDRSSSPIQLTPIGQAYYDAAKKILSTERELENRISDINNLKTGSLTIVLLLSVAPVCSQKVLPLFRRNSRM